MFRLACKKDNKGDQRREPPSWFVSRYTYIPQYVFIYRMKDNHFSSGYKAIYAKLTQQPALFGRVEKKNKLHKNKEIHGYIQKPY